MSKQECPEIPFFGASYPDARCINGFLYDLDDCDEHGDLYNPGVDVPCPFCNKEGFIDIMGVEHYNQIIAWVKQHYPDYECDFVIEVPEDSMGQVSDGYHTFDELYEFRKLYNAAFFNQLAVQGIYEVHKSKRHSDGEECFGGGWFIVMAELPTGQISNHYEMKDWDLFQIPEKEKANAWDGHTPKDVAERLRKFLTPQPKYPKTYEECCEILEDVADCSLSCFACGLLNNLQKLLLCRDAYWKIAGEEMGLNGPWKPDWTYNGATKYCIGVSENEIQNFSSGVAQYILAFPTAEMRDTFYENFKELINECKELL